MNFEPSLNAAHLMSQAVLISRKLTVTLCMACVLTGLSGCNPSSLGSNVDGRAPVPPVAKVTLVGSGTSVRAGTEVLLTGKDSDGRDGPILSYTWRQTDSSGLPLIFILRSNQIVSFTAPDVAVPTELTIELTVADDEQKTATDTVSVMVQPFADSNRFLVPLLAATRFTVTAATDQGIPAMQGAADTPFEISVQPVVTYPGRDGAQKTWSGPIRTQSGAWLGADGSSAQDPAAYNNPSFSFDLPSLDMDDINMAFQNAPADSAQRNNLLDPYLIDQAVMNIVIKLISPNAQSNAYLYVKSADGTVLASQANDGTGGPTVVTLPATGLLEASGQESAATAAAYYAAIDPHDERTTLNDWLSVNCMNGSVPDFGADAHTVYTNDFDLGFGRDMYVKADCGSSGDVASVVINYGSLEGAAKKLDPIIAVAMEYTAPVNGTSTDRYTKFYVYTPNDAGDFARVLTANFDGRGEKYVPGACVACHGGALGELDQSGVYPNNGNLDAIFMPWDLDSFLYADTDPSFSTDELNAPLRAAYTRSAQQAQFKLQNQIIHSTFLPDWPVKDLVEGWYGGAGFPSADFDGSYTPDGWIAESAGGPAGNPDDTESLYHQVFAQHCRACHTQRDVQPQPAFADYAEFIDSAALHAQRVYDEGVMPLARRTMDQFWVSALSPSPADILRVHLGLDATRTVGRPVASISGFEMQSSVNQMPFAMDGRDSQFAQTFNWSIVSRPAASAAHLVGATTAQPSFFIDQPGRYEIQLEVSNAHQQTDTAMLVLEASSVVPIAGNNVPVDVAEGGSAALSNAALSYQDPDNSASELSYTVTTVPVRGTLSSAQFTQQDIDDGLVSYTHDGSETTSDSFFFTLSDGTTDLTGQQYSFTIIPGNDAPVLLLNQSITVAEGDSAVIGGTQLAFGDVDNTPEQLVYTVTTPPMNGMLSQSTFTQAELNAATLVRYTHDGSETSSDSFVATLSDGAISIMGVTVSIIVTQVDDVPVVTSNIGLSLMEGTAATLMQTQLQTQDADNLPGELLYSVTGLPQNGALSLTSFSQQQINSGAVSYTHNGSETVSDQFGFNVTDGTTVISGVFMITVVPVSDAPTPMTNNPLTVFITQANTAITSGNLRYDDVDNSNAELIYTVTQAPAQGTLSANSFSQAAINAGNVRYTHVGNASSPAQVSFNFNISDGTTTASGTFVINVRASFDDNVMPIVSDAVDCSTAGCHGQAATPDRPDFLASFASVYSQLVPARTNFPSDRNGDTVINVMDAYLLCVSTDTCLASNGTSHNGGDAIGGTASQNYLMLRRWINEGLDAPGN